MPTSPNSQVFHLTMDKKDYDQFTKMYPRLMRIFLQNSIKLAIHNKQFFETVFFNDMEEKLK